MDPNVLNRAPSFWKQLYLLMKSRAPRSEATPLMASILSTSFDGAAVLVAAGARLDLKTLGFGFRLTVRVG